MIDELDTGVREFGKKKFFGLVVRVEGQNTLKIIEKCAGGERWLLISPTDVAHLSACLDRAVAYIDETWGGEK